MHGRTSSRHVGDLGAACSPRTILHETVHLHECYHLKYHTHKVSRLTAALGSTSETWRARVQSHKLFALKVCANITPSIRHSTAAAALTTAAHNLPKTAAPAAVHTLAAAAPTVVGRWPSATVTAAARSRAQPAKGTPSTGECTHGAMRHSAVADTAPRARCRGVCPVAARGPNRRASRSSRRRRRGHRWPPSSPAPRESSAASSSRGGRRRHTGHCELFLHLLRLRLRLRPASVRCVFEWRTRPRSGISKSRPAFRVALFHCNILCRIFLAFLFVVCTVHCYRQPLNSV